MQQGRDTPAAPRWDPAQYRRFADHRDRPFHDLLAQVGGESPADVVDLGCGPATLTLSLADRWPGARVVGVDSSAAMIEQAREVVGERVKLRHQDLRDWAAAAEPSSCDVLVSNATLQWVPDHLALLPDLVGTLRPGGWLALQVPGNHEAPLHAILRDLADTPPYAEHTRAATRLVRTDPEDYLRVLAPLGCAVDAWESTYLQVLPGQDAIFEWISGTGARPVLQALPPELRPGFQEEYRARLREAYPRDPFGTVLPFRRVFAVAHRLHS